MNGLKNSLEAAIKEMQDIPATPRINPALSDNILPGQRSLPEHSGTGLPPEANQRRPAAGSIEAALASAPSVSPHYVPPVPSVRPVRTIEPTPSTSEPDFTPQHLVSTPAEPVLQDRGMGVENTVLKSQRELSGMAQRNKKAPSFSQPVVPVARSPIAEKSAGLAMRKEEPAKNLRDGIWRWATIGISCVGGLASGWFGSNMTDPGTDLIKAGMQTIVGKTSQNTGEIVPPVGLKMARNGVSKDGSGDTLREMTGKTDRAIQTDENLCTVLELDRGTGRTLAKSCKANKTADFNSTLRKSDLLVKPR